MKSKEEDEKKTNPSQELRLKQQDQYDQKLIELRAKREKLRKNPFKLIESQKIQQEINKLKNKIKAEGFNVAPEGKNLTEVRAIRKNRSNQGLLGVFVFNSCENNGTFRYP